jgi:hypothetical protein
VSAGQEHPALRNHRGSDMREPHRDHGARRAADLGAIPGRQQQQWPAVRGPAGLPPTPHPQLPQAPASLVRARHLVLPAAAPTEKLPLEPRCCFPQTASRVQEEAERQDELSDAMLEKLRNGYAAFLERLGDVLADEQGEIAWDGLAQSAAMQCFDLTAHECQTVMSHLIPRPHKATVTAKDLLRRLGSCMDYDDQAVKACDVARIESAGTDDMSCHMSTAPPNPSWTAFKASDTLVAAGNSAGCIAIVRIDGGNEVCRFHETMQPLNGNDIPPLRRSPVTAVTWASPSTVISGSLDGVMRIWDVATRNCLWYCSGHTGAILLSKPYY